ncbi:hypothetical protein [Flavobacterium sp.]|uniref:hypothetical protein n=1 Tax=Flavobacterium sp. TaxID=239 RepID=UPI003526E489
MLSVITGDIIDSRKAKSTKWITGLKLLFSNFGETPNTWEIYRGDEFQIEIQNIETAFLTSIKTKAYLKSIGLDARMSIGIGNKDFASNKVSESNGTAFIFSGEGFNNLKKQKLNLSITTNNKSFNSDVNLFLKLGLTFMDKWTAQSAEYVYFALENPMLSQEEIGQKLGINQAAVSRRGKRAHYDLILELNNKINEKLKAIAK